MSEVCRVSVPYSSCPPWEVRREGAVFGCFSSAAVAVSAARVVASELRKRLGVEAYVEVQDATGHWFPEDASRRIQPELSSAA